jgi:hypothetical protein
MRRIVIRSALAGAAVALAATAAATSAQASPGSDYSEHVRACQQEMGFSGTHNPGVMHQGFSGWDPTHTC